MKRFFLMLAGISILMVLLASSGVYLISNTLVSSSKVDAVVSFAKGIAMTLSEQIALYERMIAKMAQDPELIAALYQNNRQLLMPLENKLALHLPDAISITIILPETDQPEKVVNPQLSFADQSMVNEAFQHKPVASIQGDAATPRHLAIAQGISHNGQLIGVILASIKFDFINTTMAAAQLDKGYIELKQDKLVLASAGEKSDGRAMSAKPIPVSRTSWEIYYEHRGMTSAVEASLIFSSIFIPALCVALAFVTGFRKFNDMLLQDLSTVIRALKDLLYDKPLAEYPLMFTEINRVITAAVQLKRVVSGKGFDV